MEVNPAKPCYVQHAKSKVIQHSSHYFLLLVGEPPKALQSEPQGMLACPVFCNHSLLLFSQHSIFQIATYVTPILPAEYQNSAPSYLLLLQGMIAWNSKAMPQRAMDGQALGLSFRCNTWSNSALKLP